MQARYIRPVHLIIQTKENDYQAISTIEARLQSAKFIRNARANAVTQPSPSLFARIFG